MNRRVFLAGLTAAATQPLAARAQQGEPLRRVHVLFAEAVEDDPYYEGRLAALTEGLHSLGWIEDRNLKLTIHRVTPKLADIRKRITQILADRPDIIVSSGGTTTAPVLQATNSIPVLFTSAVDPVGAGFVESLAQPGGNATGFMQFDYSLSAKWLELLKQVSPTLTRAGVIRDTTTTSGIGQFAVIQSVAGSLGVDVVPISSRDATEVEKGIAKVARSTTAGLIATSSASVTGQRDLVITLAQRNRLPAIYPNRTYVERGGMIAYGPDMIGSARLAAGYVDRILKGAKPADLPVQAPTKYELVVSLKAAKAIGLELPASLVARADEVIE